jgi:hypothetical protein
MDPSKNYKRRVYLYLTGVVLVCQMFMVLQLFKDVANPEVVKGIALFGFYFDCALTFFTLILVLRRRAKAGEFVVYLIGVFILAALALAMVTSAFSSRADAERAARDTIGMHVPDDTSSYSK